MTAAAEYGSRRAFGEVAPLPDFTSKPIFARRDHAVDGRKGLRIASLRPKCRDASRRARRRRGASGRECGAFETGLNLSLSCQSRAVQPHSCFNALQGDVMRVVRSRNFQFGLLLATGLSLSVLPTASEAYTDQQQQACSPDAMRLCGPEIPDVDRITACMARNREQLSPECRVFFKPDPEEKRSAGKPRKPKNPT